MGVAEDIGDQPAGIWVESIYFWRGGLGRGFLIGPDHDWEPGAEAGEAGVGIGQLEEAHLGIAESQSQTVVAGRLG